MRLVQMHLQPDTYCQPSIAKAHRISAQGLLSKYIMRVIIVGGSIAGCACAHALLKIGCEVVVLERATSVTAAGAVREQPLRPFSSRPFWDCPVQAWPVTTPQRGILTTSRNSPCREAVSLHESLGFCRCYYA